MKKKKIEEKEIHTFSELKKEEKNHILKIYDFLTYSLRLEIKKRPWESLVIFIIALIVTTIFSGVFITFITGGLSIKYSTPGFSVPSLSFPNLLGAQIYTGRSNTSYDPMELLEKIKSGKDDYLLIDIRPLNDYENGHIKTAVSMPVYKTDLVKNDGSLNKGLIRKSVNNKFGNKKTIIVYGHSQHSSFANDVASAIGSRAYPLALGWNEWAHFKALWIPESMWNDIDISNYIQGRE